MKREAVKYLSSHFEKWPKQADRLGSMCAEKIRDQKLFWFFEGYPVVSARSYREQSGRLITQPNSESAKLFKRRFRPKKSLVKPLKLDTFLRVALFRSLLDFS